MFWNMDCISGAKKYLADNSVDLIICDPPYGINGAKLDKHYNRNEDTVIDGYIEIPAKEYSDFSIQWIKEAQRILRPGGSIYIVSGYTNLRHILNALANTELTEINHIIWKYNFGVYTSKKFVSSHYHILYYAKPGRKRTFNTFAFFSDSERAQNGGAANYLDREDVWTINREYKPGQIKNKNQLPTALLAKMIMYASNPKDLVCDLFLGSFSTAKTALELDRRACGFELNKAAYDYQIKEIKKVKSGELLKFIKQPEQNALFNKGKPINNQEKFDILKEYSDLYRQGWTQKNSIEQITKKYGRGYWAILNLIKANPSSNNEQQNLFNQKSLDI
ncbi:MAG: site-specific DNA-methyltransferase [Elusimicrobiota bacterium]|jgi:site-specific DNA-methyltransferase (adenine-specific)|nr:site-specific DNA-methyltransferase [Elusimicrobiota bacterium]